LDRLLCHLSPSSKPSPKSPILPTVKDSFNP
jgi:hypothetical protein